MEENSYNSVSKKISFDKDISYISDDELDSVDNALELKDQYTKEHSDRVSAYSVLIGKKLGLSDDDIKSLQTAGLFHDIGKNEIPDSILSKNSKLSDDEYSKIKNHPSVGAHLLGNNEDLKDIIPIVEHHHERFDGSGYPNNLKGEDIPYLARIVAIADTFDAITSNRSYRNALPLDVAKDEILKCSGTQFDPDISKAFIDALENNPDTINEIMKKYQ